MPGYKAFLLATIPVTVLWLGTFLLAIGVNLSRSSPEFNRFELHKTSGEKKQTAWYYKEIDTANRRVWHATIICAPAAVFLLGGALLRWLESEQSWWDYESQPLQFTLKWLFLLVLTVAVFCCLLRCNTVWFEDPASLYKL